MYSDKIPITYQLAQLIRAEIVSGTFLPGHRLKPELQLAKDYSVSVITVQRALKELEHEGLIERHRGRGTFVMQNSASLARPRVKTALELMFSDEFDADTEVLDKGLVDTPERLQSGFWGTDKVVQIKRLAKRHGQPWSYSVHYVLPEFGKRMTEARLKRFPMFRILREDFGLSLRDVDIELEAVTAPLDVSQILQIDPLAPVLLFNGALYLADGRLVHVPQIYYRGDLFQFRFNMDLRHEGTPERRANARRK